MKFIIVIFAAVFVMGNVHPAKSGYFCDGYKEGYLDGLKLDPEKRGSATVPKCQEPRRSSRRDRFTSFRLGQLEGMKCAKQHRVDGKRTKCGK